MPVMSAILSVRSFSLPTFALISLAHCSEMGNYSCLLRKRNGPLPLLKSQHSYFMMNQHLAVKFDTYKNDNKDVLDNKRNWVLVGPDGAGGTGAAAKMVARVTEKRNTCTNILQIQFEIKNLIRATENTVCVKKWILHHFYITHIAVCYSATRNVRRLSGGYHAFEQQRATAEWI